MYEITLPGSYPLNYYNYLLGSEKGYNQQRDVPKQREPRNRKENNLRQAKPSSRMYALRTYSTDLFCLEQCKSLSCSLNHKMQNLSKDLCVYHFH